MSEYVHLIQNTVSFSQAVRFLAASISVHPVARPRAGQPLWLVLNTFCCEVHSALKCLCHVGKCGGAASSPYITSPARQLSTVPSPSLLRRFLKPFSSLWRCAVLCFLFALPSTPSIPERRPQTAMAEPIPPPLKIPEVSRFLNRANQLRSFKPAISYWCMCSLIIHLAPLCIK